MNILLEKSKFIKHYGYMNDIFGVLDGVCEEYDWYISDIELNCTPPKDLPQKQQFIKGELLKRIIVENEIQFIWAVFSAFLKDTKPVIEKIPYANGNPNYWIGSPKPQLEEALFEIVCWDSGLYLFIGVPESIGKKFKAKYTDLINLDDYNKLKSKL